MFQDKKSIKEIGGYIELDTYTNPMLYEDGIKLNCGRNALEYLIKAKGIKKILMPKFMCNSCEGVLKKNKVSVRYYSIGIKFKPIIRRRLPLEWLYIVNYYGQLPNDYLEQMGENIIIDNSQAYFQSPIKGIDTLYSCRKFFGVADGAILYTDKKLDIDFERDESFERIHFLLGRYEKGASEFYTEYLENNKRFNREPIKKMSKLTENLLHAVDYEKIKKQRTENFEYLHRKIGDRNQLDIVIPEGAFMYPFYIENGGEIRRALVENHIYVPILWPNVLEQCRETETEYKMAQNILPLPCDQRYGEKEMNFICEFIKKVC